MKKHTAIILLLAAALTLNGCTTHTESSAQSAVSSSAEHTTTATQNTAITTTTANTNQSTSSETTTLPESAAQYRNNSAGGGYVAETANCLYYIDRDILYCLRRGSEQPAVLLSISDMAQLNVCDENTLYCTSPKGIYRINTATGDAELVYPMTLMAGPWCTLVIAGETAYFSDGMTLRKSHLDFKEPEIVYSSEHMLIDQLLYANDTLYFSAYRPDSTAAETDNQSGVFACMPEGVLQITKGYCAGMTDIGSGLCISAPREQALLHLPYDTTSSTVTVLCKGQFGAVCATNEGIITNDAGMNLVLVGRDTAQTITLGAGYCLNAASDALYYLSLTDGALCKIPFSEMQAAAAS